MVRYLTLFPEAENVHLIKDVGMLPFNMHKACAYDASLVCYKNGRYDYINRELVGLKLVFLKRIFGNTFFDVVFFLLGKSKQFDVLQVFHYRFRSLLWLALFKIVRPSGITYLKLDANQRILDYDFKGLKGRLGAFLLSRIDIVSVESSSLQQKLNHQWKREILLVPNGFFCEKKIKYHYADKVNKIITVGRIGAPEKRSDLLLEAFVDFAKEHPSWQLEMVGPIDPAFHSYIEDYFKRQPQLCERVIFTGGIDDRNQLLQHYAKAKIYCSSSSWEGFPISLVEAAAAGCYIITSAIISAQDITNNEQFGRIFPVADIESLKKILIQSAGDESLLEKNCDLVQEYAHATFSWSIIAQSVDKAIKKGSSEDEY